MEALNRTYGTRGVSFYYVLSREPHPGFYGFIQTDSLDMRKDYVRLADAELQIQIPWIIDDMDNTLQKTFGGMPNAEFIIGPDGILLESREWADPTALKAFLEENIGPSNISDEEWENLGKADPSRMAIGNNDEVPVTEVPFPALHTLEASRLDRETEELPFLFSAATLPPNITPTGQSRLYLFIKPAPDKKIVFDNASAITIELTEVKGIVPAKPTLTAGRVRSGKDSIPHTLGVLWTLKDGAAQMEFRATVKAKVTVGDDESRPIAVEYIVSGAVPESRSEADEIPPENIPPSDELRLLQTAAQDPNKVPMTVAAKFLLDSEKPGEGTVYIFLQVEKETGHKWNNLSSPPQVTLKPVSGIGLKKTVLLAAQHSGQDDAEDRILAVRFALETGAQEFIFDVTPEAWICNDDLGWCRRFTAAFRLTGKI